MTILVGFLIFALICLAVANIYMARTNQLSHISIERSKRTLIQNWDEISRCQKANAALRERVGEQRVSILNLQQQLRDSETARQTAEAAISQPLPVDPDHEPTFAEIVQEVASHVSSLTTSIPVIENGTAPEPVNQIVAGTVVTTPDHTSLDLSTDPDTGNSTES